MSVVDTSWMNPVLRCGAIFIFGFLPSLCVGTSAWSNASMAPEQAQSIDLDQALRMALDETPSLHVQKQLVDLAKRERITRWLPRNPTFGYAENDDSASQQYSLALSVPFPARMFEAGRVDDVKVENAQREFRSRSQEVMRSMAQAFLSCAADRETQRLTELAEADLNRFSTLISRQYESGLSSQSEKIGIELQLAQTRSDLENVKISAESSCRRWTELSTTTLGHALPLPRDLPSTVSAEILNEVGVDSAEKLRADQTLALAEVTERNAFWSTAPDLSFSVNRNHYRTTQASPVATEWSTSYMVSISLPLFFLWNDRTDIQRTKAVARQEQEGVRIQKVQAEVDQSDACLRWQRGSLRLKELATRDLPMSEAWIESTEAAYRRGRVGFAEMLLARKTNFDLRSQQVQTKVTTVQNLLRSLGSKCS